MTLIEELIEKAKQTPKRVALPECDAEKTLLAAREVLDSGIGVPVLVSDPAVIEETARAAGVSLEGMEIVDITDEAKRDELIARYLTEERMLSEKACKLQRKTRVLCDDHGSSRGCRLYILRTCQYNRRCTALCTELHRYAGRRGCSIHFCIA